MIQRIQSLYLLLSGALMFAMFKMPLATFVNEAGVWKFYAESTVLEITGDNTVATSTIDTWPVAIIIALAGVMSFLAIFAYKNRRRQIKICMLSGMFMLLFYPIAFIYWWFEKNMLATEATFPSLGAVLIFPLVAIILNMMAVRSIKADERLVRSADRIR